LSCILVPTAIVAAAPILLCLDSLTSTPRDQNRPSIGTVALASSSFTPNHFCCRIIASNDLDASRSSTRLFWNVYGNRFDYNTCGSFELTITPFTASIPSQHHNPQFLFGLSSLFSLLSKGVLEIASKAWTLASEFQELTQSRAAPTSDLIPTS